MGKLWICKDKRRLYEQVSFAAPGETEDGVAMIKLRNHPTSPEHTFWVRRDDFIEVTFDMVESAFIKTGFTF